MVSYTVGYGPRYSPGRTFTHPRPRGLFGERLPIRPSTAPQPLKKTDRELLAGTLFILLQALILGVAIAARS